MTIFTYLEAHPERTHSILGLESEKYGELVEYLSRAEQQWNQRDPNKVYLRQPGGGAKPKLSLGQEVGLCLLVLKQAVNFEIAGILVGLSSTQAHDIFWKWLPRMRDSIPASLVEEWEALGEEGPWEADERERIVDSWEQARERPSDNQEQKKYYSGKQKMHTLKSQMISDEKGTDIIDVIESVRGPRSDIKLFQEQKKSFSAEQRYLGDKAYVGDEQILTPTKKPKGGELSAQQKEKNREISSQRIYVEHLIGRVRTFRMSAVRYRWNPEKHGEMIGVICGLVRLRMGALKLPDFARRIWPGSEPIREGDRGGTKMALAG